MLISYESTNLLLKSPIDIVVIPYFIDDDQVYILMNDKFEKTADQSFLEVPRGQQNEDILKETVRIAREINLPIRRDLKIHRLGPVVNENPLLFRTQTGTNYFGCQLPDYWFEKMVDGSYIVDKFSVIEPKESIPEIFSLDEILNGFDAKIESESKQVCGLTLLAALMLSRYLQTHCNKCHGKGFYDNTFCKCNHGKQLLEEINQSELECPVCKNKGFYFTRDHFYGNIPHYCGCKHGFNLMIQTAKNPESCPFCKGAKEYDPFDGIIDSCADTPEKRTCICTKI